MPFEPPGLVRWAVDIRLAMLDDPGRQELQNDIAISGYHWLDEYWDSILQGQNESLVDLVKTPARRKAKKAEKVTQLKPIPDENDKENTSPQRDTFKPTRNNILRDNDTNTAHNPFLEESPNTSKHPLMQAMIKEKPSEETLVEHMKLDQNSLNDHPNQIAFKPLNSSKHTPAHAPLTAEHTPSTEDDTTTSTLPRSASPTTTLTFSTKLDHTTRHTLNHKASVQTLPALPQLSPLRKSTVRGTSLAPAQPPPEIATGFGPGALPGAGQATGSGATGVNGAAGGQPARSSWLIKARAASSASTALMGMPSIQPAPIPAGRTRFAPKRKSSALEESDAAGTGDSGKEGALPPTVIRDGDGREKNAKVPRREGDEGPNRKNAEEIVRGSRIVQELPSVAVAPVTVPGALQTPTEETAINNPELEQPTTILESLKRKVEGFSSRFLKSSISGVAAGGLGGVTPTPPAIGASLHPNSGAGPTPSGASGVSGTGNGATQLVLTGSKSLGGAAAQIAAQEARAAAMARLEMRKAMERDRFRPVSSAAVAVAVTGPQATEMEMEKEKETEPETEPESVFQPLEKKDERLERGQAMEVEPEAEEVAAEEEEEMEMDENGPVFRPLGAPSRQAEKERERQALVERERERERQVQEEQRREQERIEREREQQERREQERREREREREWVREPEPEPETIFHPPAAPSGAIKNAHQAQPQSLRPQPTQVYASRTLESTHSSGSLFSTQSSVVPSVFDHGRGRVNEMGEMMSSQDTNAETVFTQPTQYSQYSQPTQYSQVHESQEKVGKNLRDEDEWMGQPPPLLRAFMDGDGGAAGPSQQRHGQGRDDTLHTADLRPLTLTSGIKGDAFLAEATSEEEDDDEGDVAVDLDAVMGDRDTEDTSDDEDTRMDREEEEEGEIPTIHAHANVQPQPHPKATTPSPAPVAAKLSSKPRTLSKMSSQDTSMSSVTSMKKSFATSKNGKGLKSLQLAAVAAKKQQEEASKKAARLKEMENRRQQILQKKQEEEKSRAALQDKKNKEEAEKRKKEREEFNEKRAKLVGAGAVKAQGSDEEMMRKNQPSRLGKPILGASTMANLPSSQGSQGTGAGAVVKPTLKLPNAAIPASAAAVPTIKLVASSSNLKASAIAGPSGPSQTLKHKSSTATLKAVAVEPSQAHPVVPSMQPIKRVEVQQQVQQIETTEYIDLPSINSEYSDEDDAEHQLAKKAAQPGWAQSPELARALIDQEHINPYHIFGDIQPLRMEEIFRNRQGRFRNRSSSANWITAGDAVTMEEEIDYARRMGFQ